MKDDEFLRVKEQIKVKFLENEQVINELRRQVKVEQDLRYQD